MNKREYKKAVEALGTGMCVEIFNIGVTTKGADAAKINDAINLVWNALQDTKHGINHYFGKKERDFENRKEYNKARNEYYRNLVSELNSKFETEIDEALKLVNAATPKAE